MKKEIWKDIPGYEGAYMVSNNGSVKSLSRVVVRNDGHKRLTNERILKPAIHKQGYHFFRLTLRGNAVAFKGHRLVMLAFVGESSMQVDHINEIKSDNRLENLRYCTNRENSTFYRIKQKKTSKYIGVVREGNYWRSYITVKSKTYFIGSFTIEEDAKNAYENKVKEINNGIFPSTKRSALK